MAGFPRYTAHTLSRLLWRQMVFSQSDVSLPVFLQSQTATAFIQNRGLISDHRHNRSAAFSHSKQSIPHRLLSMASGISEGILVGLGNPLLDITILANQEFLDKYKLEANNAILAQEEHLGIFDDMMLNFTPEYITGGATQNTIRVAQWLLQKSWATTFFGCVGSDQRAKILQEKAVDVGVKVNYQVTGKSSTGVCGAVITGEDRSLVTHLGAAVHFSHEFLLQEENWMDIEHAQFYYICGFVFTSSTEAIKLIAQHASECNKTLIMNLSAPFLCQYFADKELDIMPYVDILFGNEKEAATFALEMGWEVTDLKEIARRTASLPKKNQKRSRIVIFTQGCDPTIVCVNDQVTVHPIDPIEKDKIKDTNGCGDAFVGGFLSQVVQGKTIPDALRCGNYAAKTVIQHFGCTYPKKPNYV